MVILAVVSIAGYFGVDLRGGPAPAGNATETAPAQPRSTPTGSRAASSTADRAGSQQAVVELMRAQQSGEMVTLIATVVKVLEDDNDGSRHQRLLLEIETRGAPFDTVLIAHNIDLAPRVPASEGDELTVRGQYEFNDRGAVLHWTHHDPKDWREGGWIELNGERYE